MFFSFRSNSFLINNILWENKVNQVNNQFSIRQEGYFPYTEEESYPEFHYCDVQNGKGDYDIYIPPPLSSA